MVEILIFKSDKFKMDWPLEPSKLGNQPAWGQDCAEFVSMEMEKKGFEVSEPIEESTGWFVDVEIKGQKYTIFIQWTPMGEKNEDFWACEIRQRGFFKHFFSRKYPFLVDLKKELFDIVNAIDGAKDLKWIDYKDLK